MSRELVDLPRLIHGVDPYIWEIKLTVETVSDDGAYTSWHPVAHHAVDEQRRRIVLSVEQEELLGRLITEAVDAERCDPTHGWTFTLFGGPILKSDLGEHLPRMPLHSPRTIEVLEGQRRRNRKRVA